VCKRLGWRSSFYNGHRLALESVWRLDRLDARTMVAAANATFAAFADRIASGR